MRLTIVGSGTVSPHAARVCAGHFVEAAEVRVLFDCGNGVVHRLATLGLPWNDLTHIAITHFHYDHFGDLPALIAAMRWGQLPARAAPLTLIGPVGTKAFLEQLAVPVGEWLLKPETFDVRIVEIAAGTKAQLSIGKDVTLSAHPVPHTPESIAYSLSRAGARLVYTGDTGYDEAFADWAAECSVLLAECSLPAALAIPEHLTPETAGAIAARARPGRLVLTHMFPPVEREDIRALVAARWSGPVVVADDGTVIDIED